MLYFHSKYTNKGNTSGPQNNSLVKNTKHLVPMFTCTRIAESSWTVWSNVMLGCHVMKSLRALFKGQRHSQLLDSETCCGKIMLIHFLYHNHHLSHLLVMIDMCLRLILKKSAYLVSFLRAEALTKCISSRRLIPVRVMDQDFIFKDNIHMKLTSCSEDNLTLKKPMGLLFTKRTDLSLHNLAKPRDSRLDS